MPTSLPDALRDRRQEPLRGEEKADDGQGTGHVITAIERRHRIFVLLALYNHDADDRRDQTEGPSDEGKQNSLQPEERIQPDSKNHSTDIFRCGRFEQIRATTGAITDIVADEIGDNRRVTRIVFGNSRFDFPHQIRPNIGRFGIDTAAKLGKKSNKGGAESRNRRS